MKKAIELKEVGFAYNKKDVIKELNLTCQEGEFIGVIGPNGAGKSTLLKLLCGILKPRKGKIFLYEKDIGDMGHREIARLIGFVPQETHFTLNFPVEDVVSMGRFPYLNPFQRLSRQDREAIEKAINQATITEYRNRPVNSLSSGERQRVVIARALAQQPKILLLDEPTSHLDLHHQYRIMELLDDLNKKGMTIIIVNHDLNLASLFCGRLVLLNKGTIWATGSAREIINTRTLREVYKTTVQVIEHPQTGIPQIIIPRKEQTYETDK